MKKAFVLGVLALFAINIMSVQNVNAQGKETSLKLPDVKTGMVTDVKSNTAVVSGVVSSEGASKILECGVCWGLKSQPTVDINKVASKVNGSDFKVQITGLKPATTYYVRAYAKNTNGINYGKEVSFTTAKNKSPFGTAESTGNKVDSRRTRHNITTKQEHNIVVTNDNQASKDKEIEKVQAMGNNDKAPEVKTVRVDNVTKNSATCFGEIVSKGNPSVSDYGICWGTKSKPTIDVNCATPITKSDKFEVILKNLEPGTKYYVRAFARNKTGVSYGEEMNFKTESTKPQQVRPPKPNSAAKSKSELMNN